MSQGTPSYTRSEEHPHCNNCGTWGHWAIGCPEPARGIPAGPAVQKPTGHGRGGPNRASNGQKKGKGPIITRYAPPVSSSSQPHPYQNPTVVQYPVHAGYYPQNTSAPSAGHPLAPQSSGWNQPQGSNLYTQHYYQQPNAYPGRGGPVTGPYAPIPPHVPQPGIPRDPNYQHSGPRAIPPPTYNTYPQGAHGYGGYHPTHPPYNAPYMPPVPQHSQPTSHTMRPVHAQPAPTPSQGASSVTQGRRSGIAPPPPGLPPKPPAPISNNRGNQEHQKEHHNKRRKRSARLHKGHNPKKPKQSHGQQGDSRPNPEQPEAQVTSPQEKSPRGPKGMNIKEEEHENPINETPKLEASSSTLDEHPVETTENQEQNAEVSTTDTLNIKNEKTSNPLTDIPVTSVEHDAHSPITQTVKEPANEHHESLNDSRAEKTAQPTKTIADNTDKPTSNTLNPNDHAGPAIKKESPNDNNGNDVQEPAKSPAKSPAQSRKRRRTSSLEPHPDQPTKVARHHTSIDRYRPSDRASRPSAAGERGRSQERHSRGHPAERHHSRAPSCVSITSSRSSGLDSLEAELLGVSDKRTPSPDPKRSVSPVAHFKRRRQAQDPAYSRRW